MIESREEAGTSGHGNPIIYILTKGGLHAFFTRSEDGSVTTLGTAPHKAIAQWMSEKRDPKITWRPAFIQKKETTLDDIQKSDRLRFISLRAAIFYPKNADALVKNENDDAFLVYDIDLAYIGVVSKAELVESIEKGDINQYAVVRDLGLTTPPSVLELHPEFAPVFKRLRDG
jgi:hypothetical protein